jgi:predicted N-acyltransferase
MPSRKKPKTLTVKRNADETATAQAAYLQKLAETGFVSDAAEKAGVTYQLVKTWRENPEFTELEGFALLKQDDWLRGKVRDAINQGNATILAKAMSRLPEYRPVSETKVSVSGRVEHAHILEQLPQEERDRIIRDAAKIIELEKGEGFE